MRPENREDQERAASRTALLSAALVAALVFLTGLPVASAEWRSHRFGLAGTDSEAYVRIARALVRNGSLVLPPPSEMDANGRRGMGHLESSPYAESVRGTLLPKNSWLMGALLVPGFALFDVTGAIGTGLIIGAVLAGIVTYRAALVFGGPPATATALLSFLGLPAGRECVRAISLDATLAAVFFGAILLVERRRPAVAGALAGIALFLRPTALLLLIPVPILAFLFSGRRGLVRCIVAAVPGATAFAAVNWIVWGAPWLTAYSRTLVFGSGGAHVESHVGVFRGAILEGLQRVLLGSEGVLLGVPVVLLAILGFAFVPSTRAPSFVLPLVSAVVVLFSFVTYTYQPRFAFVLLAASVAPATGVLAALLGRLAR